MADKIDIENVAKLASLKLNEEEKQHLEKDLSMIIDHFAALSEMDLPDDKISIHPLGMHLNLAEDIASKRYPSAFFFPTFITGFAFHPSGRLTPTRAA